jgi:hypothetical protein
MLMQIAVSSWRDRKKLRDVTGDPWDGRTLEWATSSPPPDYNFAFTPVVHDNDTFADMKKNGWKRPLTGFVPIHMPANTWAGFVISALAIVLGFAIIWHMWLLTGLAFFAMMVAVTIAHTFNYKRDYYIPAEEVTRTEEAHTKLLEAMSEINATLNGATGADTSARYHVREHHPENGTLLGFWIYLMSDCLIFASLFATYAVLGRNYAGGPSGAELFDLPLVGINTAFLLVSSITFGFAMMAAQAKNLGRPSSGWPSPACSAPASWAWNCTSSTT